MNRTKDAKARRALHRCREARLRATTLATAREAVKAFRAAFPEIAAWASVAWGLDYSSVESRLLAHTDLEARC